MSQPWGSRRTPSRDFRALTTISINEERSLVRPSYLMETRNLWFPFPGTGYQAQCPDSKEAARA